MENIVQSRNKGIFLGHVFTFIFLFPQNDVRCRLYKINVLKYPKNTLCLRPMESLECLCQQREISTIVKFCT